MKEFKPTWLYIKQHNITGLKYFGKTLRNPDEYKGSGKYWASHLEKHGYDVSTVWKQLFDNEIILSEYAINFSKEHDIVESSNWANLKIEDGLMGGYYGKVSQETRDKMSKSLKGKNAGKNHPFFGKTRITHSEFMKANNPMKDSVVCKKFSDSRRGANHPGFGKVGTTKGMKLTTYKCIHCSITTTGGNLARWHNDNCKNNPGE